MSREINKLLTDIKQSIEHVEKHLSNVNSFEEFEKNDLVNDAIQRRLSIIGEALWKANKLDNNIQITGKTKIIALRHIIIHDYDIIDSPTIWVICNKHLPILKN